MELSQHRPRADRLHLLVARLDNELTKRVEGALEPMGITGSQLALLELVSDGVDTAAALASAVDVDPTSVTRTLDRLERDGRIERRPDPADRRVKRLVVSAAGLDLLPRALGAARANRDWYLRVLDAGDRTELVRLLQKALRLR
jgi:DNA-binding MarR family transcriptional regulator